MGSKSVKKSETLRKVKIDGLYLCLISLLTFLTNMEFEQSEIEIFQLSYFRISCPLVQVKQTISLYKVPSLRAEIYQGFV